MRAGSARVCLSPRGRARTPRGGAWGGTIEEEEVEKFAQRKNRRQTGDGDNLGGEKLGIPPYKSYFYYFHLHYIIIIIIIIINTMFAFYVLWLLCWFVVDVV